METTAVKSAFGDTIDVPVGDDIGEAIRKHGAYDLNALKALQAILSRIRPDVAIDIGANIGNHSLVIARHANRLISFEPNPPVFELLRNNLARNVHNAAAVNMALSNTNMELPFFIDTSGNLGKSTLNKNVKSEQCQTITVSAVRGDEYLAEVSGIDFIKIDVEGHEGEVIEGLQGIISKSQPLLLIEWNSDDTRHNFNSEKLTNMFNGYSFVALGNNYDRELYKSPRMKIKRKVMKLFKVKKEWAFIAFHRHTNYSNVFLVPPRFRETFKTINGSLPF